MRVIFRKLRNTCKYRHHRIIYVNSKVSIIENEEKKRKDDVRIPHFSENLIDAGCRRNTTS
jgi:hypothetical protein